MSLSKPSRTAILCFTIAIGIALGALGAHGLKGSLDPDQIQSFKTGVFYLLINSVGLLAIGNLKSTPFRMVYWGTLVFSFSIFLLSTRGLMFSQNPTAFSFLGPVTPLGGLLMISGWIYFGIDYLRNGKNRG